MSDKNYKITFGCNGFCGLLTILFIGLKLTHYIDWSWWWVLSPLWIPIAFTLSILAAFAGVLIFGAFAGLMYGLVFKRPSSRVF